jgi:hypothetical protein
MCTKSIMEGEDESYNMYWERLSLERIKGDY